MRSWWIATCWVAWTVAGCAPVQPSLTKDQRLDPNVAYVGAVFQVEKGQDYGFVLVDAGGREYVLSFSRGSSAGRTRHVSLVPVPPGDYRVAYWVSNTRVASAIDRHEVTNPALSKPFPVKVGQVLFLGAFSARSDVTHGYRVTYYRWSIQPQRIAADEVVQQLRLEYPSFARARVECVLCTAPAPDAVEYANPVSKASGEFSSAHDVVIHYHRKSGNYSGWGLHVWEELPRAQSRLLTGVTWQTPLMPAGEDDFGSYWSMNDTNFRNGRVPFLIHDGDIKDVPRAWSLTVAREVWVIDGEPQVFRTKEDALAAVPK